MITTEISQSLPADKFAESNILPRPSTRYGDMKRTSRWNEKQALITAKEKLADFSETELASTMSTGTCIGMTVGACLGSINATLAVIVSPFVIPGLDLFVSQLADAAMIGASLGIIFGGLIGALLGWGVANSSNWDQKPELTQASMDQENLVSFCPAFPDETSITQNVETWKSQHGEYANI